MIKKLLNLPEPLARDVTRLRHELEASSDNELIRQLLQFAIMVVRSEMEFGPPEPLGRPDTVEGYSDRVLDRYNRLHETIRQAKQDLRARQPSAEPRITSLRKPTGGSHG